MTDHVLNEERLTQLRGKDSAALATETVQGWSNPTINRARFERIVAVAELAYEWMNAPADSGIARRAEDALSHAVDALQSGDLDPLP